MSADRWTKCPNCKAEHDKKLMDSYGKLSVEEYLALANSYDNDENILREDFYVGVHEDGVLEIDYNCECCTCSFKRTHKNKVMLL